MPITRKSTPLRFALHNFVSQFLVIPQGTGILSIILHQLQPRFSGLTTIARILWILTVVLLLLIISIYILRIYTFPRDVHHALSTDANEIACLACVPITFTTIVQNISLNLTLTWGRGWGQAAYVLWWINAVLALAAVIGIPYGFVRYSHPGRGNLMSPAAQLPYIAALTAAAGGAIVGRYSDISAHLQVPVIIVSYLFIGLALPLAYGQNQVFLTDLTRAEEERPLARMQLFAEMILCGPWGQSSFALMALGAVVLEGAFERAASGAWISKEAAGPVGYISILAGLLAWGQGTFWWAFAILSIAHGGWERWREEGLRGMWENVGFGLPAWSLVFPWGVYTNAAVEAGILLDSEAFRYWSVVLAIGLVLIWLVNMAFTIQGLVTGTLFGLEKGWKVPKEESEESQENGEKSDSS